MAQEHHRPDSHINPGAAPAQTASGQNGIRKSDQRPPPHPRDPLQPHRLTKRKLLAQNADLRAQLEEAQETLRAIHSGEVDAVVVENVEGCQVFTLKGADYPYRVLLQEMQDAAIIISSDGTILFSNQYFSRLMNIPLKKLLSTRIDDYIARQDRKKFRKLLSELNNDGTIGEIRFQVGRDKPIPMALSLTRVPDADGICLVGTDLSRQKRIEEQLRIEYELAQEALRESEVHLARAQQISHLGSWSWDLGNDRQFWTDETYRLLGMLPGEIPPRLSNFLDFIHPEDREQVEAAIQAAFDHKDIHMQFRVHTKNGEERYIYAEGSTIFDKSDTPVKIEGIFQDITERKREEEAHTQLEQSLQWSRRREELLGSVANRLLSTEDPQAIVNDLCQETMAFLDCDVFFNYLVDLQRNQLHLNASAGIPEEEIKKIEWLDYRVAVCGCAARDASRIGAEHIPPSPDPRTDLVKSFGVQAYACHPLLVESQVIGTISFGTRSREVFTDEELGVMKSVADSIAIAMHRLMINRDLHQVNENLLRSKDELRETEQYLENLITYANAPILVWNPQYRITRFNQAFEKLTGRKSSEVIGQSIEILFPKQYRTVTLDLVHTSRDGNRPDVVEIPILTQDGDIRTVLWSSATIYEADGKTVLSTIAQGQDITERKRVEQALSESMAQQLVSEAISRERGQLFNVLETLPIMISLLTPDYRVAFANRSFREAFGESHGRHCYEYCFGRTEPCEFCETFKVLKTGSPHQWEVTRGDGTVIEAYDFPFTDTDGSPMILEMDIDITEQRQAQEMLQRAYQYTRTLIEVSLDPLVTISPEGTITDVNEATIRATGRSRESLIGTDFSSCFTEPEQARAGYRRVFEEGQVMDYPLTLRSVDGHLTDVLYNASVYRDTTGNVQGIFAAARDVTERKRVELELSVYRNHLEELVKERTDALNEYAESLKRSNEDLERFAYIASHDLQEPLRNVVSFSQLLSRRYQGKLDADADEYIGFIVEGGKRMQNLVQDLLEYSRVNIRGQAFQPVRSLEMVEQVVRNLQVTVDESHATITTGHLPNVLADPTQLTLVFQNLLGNAIKFRKKNEPPQIHIAAEKMEDMWKFAVHDNGIGIDPAFYERIFVIFQRLHTRDKYPGTGVGLAIVKKIVERHGGEIWVESEVGEGSTFYFTLPPAGEGNPVPHQ
jgi:PAS domain S-box-containing protein